MYTCIVRSVFISTIRFMAVLGKIAVAQLIKEFFTVCGTRSSIATRTSPLLVSVL